VDGNKIPGIQRLPVFFDHFQDAPERDQPCGGLHDEATQVAHWPDQPDDQPGVSDVRSGGNGPIDCHQRSGGVAAQHLEAADDVGDGPKQRVHGGQLAAAQVFLPVVLIELGYLVRLAGKRFHHPHAGEVFLQGRRKHRFLLLESLIGFGNPLEEENGSQDHYRDRDDRDQSQGDIQAQDGDEIHQEEQDDAADADSLVGEEAADGVDIRGRALDQLAGLGLVVIGETQPLDVIVEVIAHPAGDAFGGKSSQPPGEKGKSAFHRSQADKPQRKPDQLTGSGGSAPQVIHELAQQQVNPGLCQGSDCLAGGGAQVSAAVTGGQRPQAGQLVGVQGCFQVECSRGW